MQRSKFTWLNQRIAKSASNSGSTMHSSVSVPLLFPHLLADRKGNFSALRLDFGPGSPDLLISVAESEEFLAIVAEFPCLYRDDTLQLLAPTLAAAFAQAGCRPLVPERVGRCDDQLGKQFAADIEWVDGDWYLVPPAKPSSSQSASRALALQLVQLVAADADTHQLEAVFRRDPTLSYHLLRLVNSLAVGVGRRITSFSQAIVILGRQQLRRWLNLMLFSARDGDPRSGMLLARVAVRARTMELLARGCGLDKSEQEQAFMAGMFSMLGVLFGLPIEEVLRPLTISDATRAAVLAREGEIGGLLGVLESAERKDFVSLGRALEAIQIAPADFNLSAIEAFGWMLSVVRDSQGRADA
jgi:EAL and modified HD-GYP domain-containing signal transduction protein